MFLKCEPNPHRAGQMTRAVFMENVPGQRFAIDAEELHKRPELLNAFGRNMYVRFRVLDALAYFICLLGFLATLAFVWWAFIPGLAICALMLAVNRKSAGEIARRAASRSVDNFRALHEMGCLWLVYA
ncbi:hypothetical protein [Hyphomonas johnsonii]|jgi:hypothetical protein|uniref:Uncharacterized protein n=1 Tax=Hyphomonas johnsonii MHS-2 TaxID=1280950 RepID=A0A059FHK6_9PROT|nr:hypothetical protein [Hyphomonas johnsonii]KCZ90077.1 hypothetical protein HJO_14046 [Hyphomonas johnsonii MHS-2]